MSVASKIYRLRSSVALVRIGKLLELFDANERVFVRIEIDNDSIISILQNFDGQRTVREVAESFSGVDLSELEDIVIFLNERFFLIEIDRAYDLDEYARRPRLYNHLEGLFEKTSKVEDSISRLDSKKVLVIGLGGVGTWVVRSLASVGVKHVYMMDDDVVELSNIHRQDFYEETDIGLLKTDSISAHVKNKYGYRYQGISTKVSGAESFRSAMYDLIINCADWPSVDETSQIVSDYCMPLGIPHVIGGGYNLHLTLIGQAIIPGKSACLTCFNNYFTAENARELRGVKKLYRESRKIGSLGAACAISASVTALESIKILLDVPVEKLAITNKRLEFNFSNMEFSSTEVPLDSRCGSCGWGAG